MSDWADLHLHSTCSDGADPPEEVVARAAAAGARALALTDHDTTGGNDRAAAAAQAHGLQYLRGVEVSTVFERLEVHVVVLGARPNDAPFEAALSRLREARTQRSAAILVRLAELGHALSPEALLAAAGPPNASPGRMHIARALADAGVVRKPQDAFDRLLNPGRPAYVPREKLDTAQALDLIHAASGLAFVAHPGLNKSLRKALPRLLALPFDGIEAYHVSHTPGRMEELTQLAEAQGLLISGGSDCHGGMKGGRELGRVRLPWSRVAAILERIA